MKFQFLKTAILLVVFFFGGNAVAQFEKDDKEFQRLYELFLNEPSDKASVRHAVAMERRARELGNDLLLCEALRSKGRVVYVVGSNFETLDIVKEYEKVARKINNRRHIFKALCLKTDAYNLLKDFRSAQLALAAAGKYKDGRDVEETADYLCCALDLNYSMGEYRKSIENGIAALPLARKLGDGNMEHFIMYFMGCAYGELYEGTKALEMLNGSLKLAVSIEDTFSILGDYSSIAEVYIDCYKNPDKGLEYLKMEREMADLSNMHFQVYELSELYSRAYELKKDYQKALFYNRKAVEEKEKELDHERQRELRDLDHRYRTKEKEHDIALLMRKQRSQKELLRSRQQTAIFAFIGLALMVVVSLVGAVAYRNSRRHSRYLAQDKERKTLLLQEVHHRVNNSLQMTSALLSMQSAAAASEETKDALRQTEARIHSMASLHALLNEDTAAGLTVSMKEYLHRLLDFHRSVIDASDKVELETAIEDLDLPSAMALPLALCVNELVTNAMKYAFPEGKEGLISVKLNQENDDWVLTVCDNGKGFSDEAAAIGTGLGGDIVRILVNQLKGRLEVNSNQGACFRLYFKMADQKAASSVDSNQG